MDEWLKTRNLPLHFISVAGLVYKGDEVLLIKSKRRGWEIPGGVVAVSYTHLTLPTTELV